MNGKTECVMHADNPLVERCAHDGSAYVVQMWSVRKSLGWVDYIVYDAAGIPHLAYWRWFTKKDGRRKPSPDTVFASLVDRMLAGEGPVCYMCASGLPHG